MSISVFGCEKRCPHCEVKLSSRNVETDVEADKIRMIKCGACGTASTWIDGNLRSHTKSNGEQTIGSYTPFQPAD